jgi:hypothetical protein
MNIDEPPSEDFADADKEDEGEEDENRSQTSPMDGMNARKEIVG